MNKRIRHLLVEYDDSARKIATAYGCSGNAVWRELCGERISKALREFISSRWKIRYKEFMAITGSDRQTLHSGRSSRHQEDVPS